MRVVVQYLGARVFGAVLLTYGARVFGAVITALALKLQARPSCFVPSAQTILIDIHQMNKHNPK